MTPQEEQEVKESINVEPDFMKTGDEVLLERLKEAPYVAYVDMYYRGAHVGKTFRHFSESTIDAEVEDYINRNLATDNWKPSWKDEPAKSASLAQSSQPVPQPREFHTTVTSPDNDEGDIMCPIHGEKMFQRQGKFGNYFSHGWQENGYWQNCSGKGAKQGRPVS